MAANIPVNVLNSEECAKLVESEAMSPNLVSEKIRKLVLKLYGEFLSEDGKGLDYKAMVNSERFKEFVQATALLRTVNPFELTTYEEKMSFFLNLYNILVVHGVASSDMPNSVLSDKFFFKRTCYNIGGYNFSLDDIEHGVLRGNAKHPKDAPEPTFPEGDGRRAFVLDKIDPRIHFALVCGAKSCPPIRVYTPNNLEKGLSLAAKSFCDQEVEINDSVTLSKIFFWYGSDFASDNRGLLEWIVARIGDEKKEQLSALLKVDGEVDVKFRDYDWSLNKQDENPPTSAPAESEPLPQNDDAAESQANKCVIL